MQQRFPGLFTESPIPLISGYVLKFGDLIFSFKVYSLIKGYGALWVREGKAGRLAVFWGVRVLDFGHLYGILLRATIRVS